MARITVPSALVLSVIALSACGRGPDVTEAAPPSAASPPAPTGVSRASTSTIKPLAQKKFGTDISEKTSTSLDALLREPRKFATRTVRTEGVVSAVCKSMGCWMELADDAGHAHIKMAGHSFFVPKDSAGHRAVVQGRVVDMPKDECTEEAEQQTGSVAKIEIEATGVEFVD
jgi:hypothetical protein